MLALLKRFFSEIKEWSADAADHIRLFMIRQKIEGLNEELEFGREFGMDPCERHQILILLDMYSETHNMILHRIKLRERQYYAAQAH